MEKIVIIGAGIVGACLAYELSRLGRSVSVIETGLPAQAASGRSFGWINASFSLSEAHFALRVAGMETHQRLAHALPGHHRPTGCLWWEESGAAFQNTARRLENAGYPLKRLEKADLLRHEPALRDPPDEALLFEAEAWVDAANLTRALLAASGAQVFCGIEARLSVSSGRITGVATDHGPIAADQVVIAAGTGAPRLLAPLGLNLSMLSQPGQLLRTNPVDLPLRHILVSPDQELRQEDDGSLLAPMAAAHQSSSGDMADHEAQTHATLERISNMLGLSGLLARTVVQANRPVPGDGLPVLGPVPQVAGLWLAVLHSGVTLAPIVAQSLGSEIAGQGMHALLAPFRPERLL